MKYDAWYLRRLPSGSVVWLCCRDDVSQFFGWDQVFERYYPGKGLRPDGDKRSVFFSRTGLKANRGGTPFRVLRGPRKGVFTAGLTHSFRLRGTWSPRDLRQVMGAVQVDWNWLKLPDGRVWDKERLVQTSHPGPPRGAGLSR